MSVPSTSFAPASPVHEAESEEVPVSTQPHEEVDLSFTNDDSDVNSIVNGAVDLTESPVKTAPPQIEDIVPEESVQPLAASLNLLASYVKTLRFKDQQDTVSDFGTAFLRKFATYYHESKSILVLQGDLTKTPKSCTVSIPFKPLDAISEGMACKAFVKELAEATAKLQLSANEYYLRGKCMNNKARKQELIEIFAMALPVFADFILEDVGISSIEANDLVADLLMYHPDDALKHIDGLDLASFIDTFKKVNDCGRRAIDGREVYRQCFPEDSAFLERRSASLAQRTEKTGVSPPVPLARDNETPIQLRKLDAQSQSDKCKGRGRGIKLSSLAGTHFKTALEALRASPYSENNAAAIAALEAQCNDDVFADPQESESDKSTPTQSINLSHNPHTQPQPNKVTQLSHKKTPNQSSVTTPKTVSLQSASNKFPPNAQTQTAQTGTFVDSMNQQSTVQVSIPTPTTKLAATAPSPLRKLVNPYTGYAFFSSTDEKRAELEVAQLTKATESTLRLSRMKECYLLALTNSIRSQRNAFILQPDDGPPPDFNIIPSPTGMGFKEPLCSGPPSKANLLAPKQTITFDTTNGGIKQCLSLLSTYVHQVFTRPKSLYIDQYLYNQKARKISKIAKKARMNETAKRTMDELLKTDKAGSDIPKALEENIRKRVRREQVDSNRKIQSLTDLVEQEKKKNLKIQRELEKLKKKQQSKNSTGASTQGASEQNTSGMTSAQTDHRQMNQSTRKEKEQSRGNGRKHREGRGGRGGRGGRSQHSGHGARPTPQAGGADSEQQSGGGNKPRVQFKNNAKPKPSLK